MSAQKFWLFLGAVSVMAWCLLVLWDYWLPDSEALSPFSAWCVVVFVCINILAFFAARSAVQSPSKYRFIHLIMGMILLKMLICVGLIVAHVKVNHPESKLFVLPFLTTYLIFTVFEVYMLEKIARSQPEGTQT